MVMSPKRKAEVKSIAKVLALHIALMRLGLAEADFYQCQNYIWRRRDEQPAKP